MSINCQNRRLFRHIIDRSVQHLATPRVIALKEKTAKRIANAIVDALDAHQLSAKEFLEALMEAPLPAADKKLLEGSYKAGWVGRFKKFPEPDERQLAQALAMFDALKNAPGKMRALLKQRIKELPHAPGGAPKKIKIEEERTVCAEVEALRPEYDTRGAIRIVAAKRRVSERTIYRIWGKYHPKKTRRKPRSS